MCFGLEWIEHIVIVVIVICAIIALLRLLVSFVLPRVGIGGEIVGFIVSAAYIVMWAVIGIVATFFVFDLIGCLLPYAGSIRPR